MTNISAVLVFNDMYCSVHQIRQLLNAQQLPKKNNTVLPYLKNNKLDNKLSSVWKVHKKHL